MRSSLLLLTFAAFLTSAVLPAAADPAGDLNQAVNAFAQIQSVHIDVAAPQGGGGTIDQVGTNKMRASWNIMGRQVQLVRIGKDSWVNMNGQWIHDTHGNGTFTQIASAQSAVLQQKDVTKDYTVSSAGTASVNGTSGQKYHLVKKDDPSDTADVVIGPNHLPLQLTVNSSKGPLTFTYSNYNGVADITPPM